VWKPYSSTLSTETRITRWGGSPSTAHGHHLRGEGLIDRPIINIGNNKMTHRGGRRARRAAHLTRTCPEACHHRDESGHFRETRDNITDYNSISTSVAYAANQTTSTINVTPVDDKQFEGPETVTSSSMNDGSYDWGPERFATVTIMDNDVRLPLTYPVHPIRGPAHCQRTMDWIVSVTDHG